MTFCRAPIVPYWSSATCHSRLPQIYCDATLMLSTSDPTIHTKTIVNSRHHYSTRRNCLALACDLEFPTKSFVVRQCLDRYNIGSACEVCSDCCLTCAIGILPTHSVHQGTARVNTCNLRQDSTCHGGSSGQVSQRCHHGAYGRWLIPKRSQKNVSTFDIVLTTLCFPCCDNNHDGLEHWWRR